MSETADRYRRLSHRFGDRIHGIPEDAWDAPTPCVDWTVRDLVSHVIQTQGMFLRFVDRDVPDVDAVADTGHTWRTVSAAVQADLDDPELASATFEGFSGTQSFQDAVDRFLNTDLVVHGWDLSRATGQDDTIDPGDMDRVMGVAKSFGDAMRGAQAFGPELEPPAGADDQTRFLAFLGRRA